MEKHLENLRESEKTLQTAGHLAYVTFPLVKDKRLLLKILLEIKDSLTKCINSILQYEYLFKRIRLHENPQLNLQTFINKCAPRYKIPENEIRSILLIFELAEKHKKSPFEFVRREKIVIMSENLHLEAISLEKIKEFLGISKNILEKAKSIILR